MKKRNRKRRRGQTIVEYVLIICIVVVASIGILSMFSNTVREKIAGIVKTFDSDADVDSELKDSKEIMQELDKEGLQ
jgi:Flp pilus assembly pilin Flp